MTAQLPLPLPAVENYELSTKWPEARKRWAKGTDSIGVYAIVYDRYAYVGMTVSVNGFKGRWAKHHRNLFVKKRSIAHKKFKKIVKDHELSPQDFSLYILKAWTPAAEGLVKELTSEIALEEQKKYDELELAGFTMVNTVRPTGAGYVTTATVAKDAPLLTVEGKTMELEGKDSSGRGWKITGRSIHK